MTSNSVRSTVPQERDTAWFRDARWGVFMHFLTEANTTADDWNRRVDGFDVDALAGQLAEIGAGYYFITLGQGSGHYCAPNATYDELTGIRPSKCSQRDLVADLHAALAPRGIALMAYVPADGSWADPQARAGLKQTAHWSDDPNHDWGPGPHWARYRLPEFQQNWETVCRDWSLRFGDKVRGWWVDGAYAKEHRYPEDDAPNLRTYADALRAGNPEALVAFNSGVWTPVRAYSQYEDYTAGEIADDLPQCPGGSIEGDGGHRELYHVLSYLGAFWGRGEPRFPDALVAGYTQHVNSHGGVVTWDVPFNPDGTIAESFRRQLGTIAGHFPWYQR